MIYNLLVPDMKQDEEAAVTPRHEGSRIWLITHWFGSWFRVREE